MEQARHEVLDLYDADAEAGEVADILVSCDGTRQKRGFTLYGACFVIAHETSKVVDNAVMSKHCVGCHRWEKWDKTSSEYLEWKPSHVCGANYEGSSAGMEPHGMVKLFQRSLDFHIRYKYRGNTRSEQLNTRGAYRVANQQSFACLSGSECQRPGWFLDMNIRLVFKNAW